MPNLDCTGIDVKFGGTIALSGVSFSLAPGSIVGLVGPNGSGKTTLLNVIAGQVAPKRGRVTFGTRLSGRSRDELARLGVFRSYQNARLFESLTGEENVAAAYRPVPNEGLWSALLFGSNFIFPTTKRRHTVSEALDFIGAQAERRKPAMEMSFGMRKRMILAQALAAKPKICLLDEPLAGADPRTRLQMLQAIKRLQTGDTIVVWVEHDVDAILSLANRVLVLDRGRIVADDEPSKALGSETVRKIYFQPT